MKVIYNPLQVKSGMVYYVGFIMGCTTLVNFLLCLLEWSPYGASWRSLSTDVAGRWPRRPHSFCRSLQNTCCAVLSGLQSGMRIQEITEHSGADVEITQTPPHMGSNILEILPFSFLSYTLILRHSHVFWQHLCSRLWLVCKIGKPMTCVSILDRVSRCGMILLQFPITNRTSENSNQQVATSGTKWHRNQWDNFCSITVCPRTLGLAGPHGEIPCP